MERDMNDQAAVWAAVDKLTKDTRQKVLRAGDADWRVAFDEATRVCVVAQYRAAFEAATSGYAIIPSLWEQSTIALTGGEVQAGRGSKPLRERSIADLDLMEIRSIIRDTTRHELERLGEKTLRNADGSKVAFHPNEMRRFASLALEKEPDRADWWQYRFEAWGRLLTTYLRNAEHQARPVYLRNSACPTCRTRQVTIDRDGEPTVVPALVIDFRDGYVRAAQCQACDTTWFRGPDLEQLAADLGEGLRTDTPDGMMTA
jgi:hypothetical protein